MLFYYFNYDKQIKKLDLSLIEYILFVFNNTLLSLIQM